MVEMDVDEDYQEQKYRKFTKAGLFYIDFIPSCFLPSTTKNLSEMKWSGNLHQCNTTTVYNITAVFSN